MLEFPKIRGSNIDTKMVGLQLQGQPETGHPQFIEIALWSRALQEVLRASNSR